MSFYWELPKKARYRLTHTETLPLWSRTHAAIGHYHDAIVTADISTVRSVVAMPRTSWASEHQELLLFTFGTFANPYRTIEVLAKALAFQYQQIGVLPVIRPVLRPRGAVEGEPAESVHLARRFSKSGLLLVHKKGGE